MIAGVIQEVNNGQEAKDLLARWRRFGNFMMAYIVPPRPGSQDLRFVGVFYHDKQMSKVIDVPPVRHGDNRPTA